MNAPSMLSARTFLLLRSAVAFCFIGHGAFGIIGKTEWLPYFATAGIGAEYAWLLMPVIGTIDITVGILALVHPTWAGFAWAAFWALTTAAMRPLAGESVWELIERAGNYGVPIALLAWAPRPRGFRAAFARMHAPELNDASLARLRAILVVTTATLLMGHGALAFFEQKPLLAAHWTVLGLGTGVMTMSGALEMLLAATVLVWPSAWLLLAAVGWKLATEALFPLSGAPVWEFVERAGSYFAPLVASLLPLTLRAYSGGPVLRRARTASLPLVLLPLLAMPAAAQDPSLIEQLERGGLVLVCRHAITDRSHQDRSPVDLDDRTTQRNLSAAGEEQARAIGRELRRLHIPIGEVLTSPYFRTLESAELTFGAATVHDALAFNGSDDQFRTLLGTPPAAGTNRALMSHFGRIVRVLPERELGGLEEGDCAVVRPDGRDFTLMGRIRAREWATLR